ncbi:MAG: CapA family protein [Leptolyngbyaceae cyanobacterium]
MVNAASNLSPEKLSTKALAAAGQFRAIALWLNEPLIPEKIYAQVSQDQRPGCIRIIVEFERQPLQKPLTQFICHLMWQLNSPLIEGIHLLARPVGERQPVWQQRIRVMTPALRERLKREQGKGSAAMPPTLAARKSAPRLPGLTARLLTGQLKTLRASMLTGSAVAAFVFGCMIEVVMSNRQEPALPFQNPATSAEVRSQPSNTPPQVPAREPQLPAIAPEPTVLVDRQTPAQPQGAATAETTAISYQVEPERDRPNVVNAALEPVGVLKHERLPAPQDPTVTLLFGGDVDLDGLPYEQLVQEGQLLSGLPAYRQADVAMVNLQDPLATAATSLEEELLERQRPDAIDLLKAGGVDVVNLTGDKSLSFGEQGLAETLDTLDRNGIFRVGAGRSEREARRPEIMDVKGQRIAYLSYDRDFTLAAYDSVSGVNAVNMQEIVKDIQAIRDEVDWLVVNYRWSTEPPQTPAESQTNLARLAIDQGADLVVGHHPNQLQGAEIYKGRPIAYSLGDFVFGTSAEAPTAETAVLQVSLRDGQMKVDLIPVKVTGGQPQQANETEAEQVLAKIRSASSEFQTPMPTSVVLNAGTGVSTEESAPAGADSFTGDTEENSSPFDAKDLSPEQETAPEAAPPPSEAAPPQSETAPAPSSSPEPVAEDELLDIEIEAIPEDLLKEWGPKDSPNTIYEPESALPDSLRVKPKDSPAAQPKTIAEPAEDESAAPPPAPTTAAEPTTSAPATPEAIAPYSEPLGGPMSVLSEPPAAMKPATKGSALAPLAQAGMPISQVFEPLNTVPPSTDAPVTVEIQPVAVVNGPEAH